MYVIHISHPDLFRTPDTHSVHASKSDFKTCVTDIMDIY